MKEESEPRSRVECDIIAIVQDEGGKQLLLTNSPERLKLQVFGAPYKKRPQKTFGPEEQNNVNSLICKKMYGLGLKSTTISARFHRTYPEIHVCGR